MLNEYKQKTKEICKKKGWDGVSTEHLWLFFIEEVGELASSIRRTTRNFSDRKKVNIEGEVMDVMSYLLQIADTFDIDLDESWERYVKNA